MTAQRIHADRNTRGAFGAGVGIHAERELDVGIAGEVHGAKRYRLQRLLGDLAEYGGEEQAHLGARRRLVGDDGRIALGADDGMQG